MTSPKQFLAQLEQEHTLQEAMSATPPMRADEAYKSARVDRHNIDHQPPHRSGDAGIYDSWDLMTRRVRDMALNDPFVKRAGRALSTLVVGCGINTFAEAVDFDALIDPTPELDDLLRLEPFNAESDYHFEHYAKHGADAHGEKSLGELHRMAMKEMVDVGNCFLVRCQMNRRNQSVPVCWDFVEWEQLDRTKDRPAGDKQNRIVNGIEYFSNGNVAGYWFFDSHPYDMFPGAGFISDSTFVPWWRVVHLYIPMRPSARSGASWYNALVQPARDLDFYFGNTLTRSALQALLTVVVKRRDPGRGNLGFKTDQLKHSDRRDVRLGAGTIGDMFTDEDVELLESKGPPGNAVPWLDLILHQMSAASDISYYRLTGNYANTSYSSTRAAHLDDEIFNHPLQMYFADKVALPMRNMHDRQMAALGMYKTVTASEYLANQRDFNRFYVIGPGRPLLDPDKEMKGAGGLMRMAMSTLKEQCGRRGLNWRRVIDQRAIETEYARRRGVVLDFTAQQGGGIEQQTDSESDGDDMESRLFASLQNRFNGNGHAHHHAMQ